VTLSFLSRRLCATLASALCLASVALLAPPPGATAQARRAACPPSSARHPGRTAATCERSGRTSGVRAHARAKRHIVRHEVRRATGRHARHEGGRRAKGRHTRHEVRKAKRGKRRAAKRPALSGRIGWAVCEDGTAPILAGDGSISCQDGSEPICESGAGAAPPSDGSALVCAGVFASGGAPPATCDDGTAPTLSGEASFSCQDGSEPICESGAGAVPSSDGSTLVCELAAPEEHAG
jgi:hypothetical protein